MLNAVDLRLSDDALYVVVRGLADMGEDYGWYVYGKGYEIPAEAREELVAQDENAKAWLEAYDAASAAYLALTGEPWRY